MVLAAILRNWKLFTVLGILVVLLSIIGVYKVKADSYMKDANTLRVQNGQLQEKINQAVQINKENLAVIDQMQKDAKTKDQVVQTLNQTLSKNRSDLQKLRDNLSHSKPEDNGSVAPVLRDVIRGVQNAR
ncbi:hypothetical protein RsoM2USA_423 [Ralstonia phage RsoM2USA]|nr:hypothetical protein RsoM2USA_423 [Ralstonia phage RsoM2USA]